MFASLSYTAGTAVVTTPFNEAFVSDLKSSIPSTSRRWDADHKVWRVDPPYGPTAARVLLAHFPYAEIDAPVSFTPGAASHACNAAPDRVLRAVQA